MAIEQTTAWFVVLFERFSVLCSEGLRILTFGPVTDYSAARPRKRCLFDQHFMMSLVYSGQYKPRSPRERPQCPKGRVPPPPGPGAGGRGTRLRQEPQVVAAL